MIVIKSFDEWGDWIAREKIAEEERDSPHGNNHKHAKRPNLETFDRKNADVERHNGCLGHA